ncbi:MAG TPA: hypothetical protein DIU00_24495 [Phycisphaerales bacterium]|nr:hypothetical protein [Phycisphaerales bacterium]
MFKMLRINLRGRLITSILLFAALCISTFGKTIYVDDDAAGANDGSNWENAYTFLQEALSDAELTEKPVEIRVAQGVYKPSQGLVATPEFDWLTATFQLIDGVTLTGGYAGLGELDPNIRDIVKFETILSGDLHGDDAKVPDANSLLNDTTRQENSHHVVTASNIGSSAVMEGLTITGGNANGEQEEHTLGGGLYCLNSHLEIVHCFFRGNISVYGGAIFNDDFGALTVKNCHFIRNTAAMLGGAIDNTGRYSILVMEHCTFTENHAVSSGGAIMTGSSDPMFTNCIFERNSSARGGGIYNFMAGNPTLVDCMFIGNSVEHFGGGMYNNSGESGQFLIRCTFKDNFAGWYGGGFYNSYNGKPLIENCIFVNNSSSHWGGAIHFWRSIGEIRNCTVVNNSAQKGGALGCGFEDEMIPSNVKISNCIIWGNGEEIYNDDNSQITITHGCIKDLIPGRFELPDGCINEAPCFAEPRYLDANGVWVDGDYHLKSEAGRWDPYSESWVVDDVTSPCIDAGDPNSPVGDEPEPNGGIINMGAYGGTAEASMSPAGAEEIVYIQWLGHASVKVWTEDCIVYVDPQNLNISPHDATFVCVTHTHGDHYSPSDIARVSNAQTQFIGPPDVVQRYGSGQTIAPGQTIEFDFVTVKAVPAYNTNKPNHPKSNNWVGFILELGGKRIYVAGDTDLIEEMKSLGDIDVAFLPAGGTYTMNATEAAEATGYIKPDLAIPYHWGRIVGTLSDAQTFAELARCPAKVMAVGETISSDDWPVYSPLIAHWPLDEAEGDIANDSAGDNHGTLEGEPVWQPAGGKIDGALLLDGIDDYISTDFVLDPAKGSFSVFAWIQGGAPYQVIISQADILTGRFVKPGSIWLCVDPLDGKLMTYLGLASAGSPIPPAPRLVSESVITDGQWHHVGFVWDGSYRSLYVDGIEAARDTAAQNPLQSVTSGLRIGANGNLEAGNFFSGLIDDVRIYNIALEAEQIEELARKQ